MIAKVREILTEFAGEVILALAVTLLMQTCADALPVSPTVHHVFHFLIEMFGV